jgi:hypothetical protein
MFMQIAIAAIGIGIVLMVGYLVIATKISMIQMPTRLNRHIKYFVAHSRKDFLGKYWKFTRRLLLFAFHGVIGHILMVFIKRKQQAITI